jgi:hypothetical protein
VCEIAVQRTDAGCVIDVVQLECETFEEFTVAGIDADAARQFQLQATNEVIVKHR